MKRPDPYPGWGSTHGPPASRRLTWRRLAATGGWGSVPRARRGRDARASAGETPAVHGRSESVRGVNAFSYRDSQPPSTASVVAWTYSDAGDARNTTAPARSEGVPQRPAGMRARI